MGALLLADAAPAAENGRGGIEGGAPPPAQRADQSMQPSNESRDALLSELYSELHRRAAQCMRDQRPSHTLQPTALVHEVFLKMCGRADPVWRDRVRFLSVAAQAMRHVLVDHARSRGRAKRTPHGEQLGLDQVFIEYEDRALDLVALDAALHKLSGFDPQMARAVELRFFGGLSMEETAAALELPLRTLERRFVAVRAWLSAELA